MLKHVLLHHPGQEMFSIEFGMKIRKFCKFSFERQVHEAVTIQEERKEHFLMNSKSEYNRCSLPRLSTKFGEQEIKDLVQEQETDKKDEEWLDKKIREMRKHLNKTRLHPTKEGGPKPKRRKVGDSDYVSIGEIWGKPDMSKPAKTKLEMDENPRSLKMAKVDDLSPPKTKIPTFPPPIKPVEISQLLPKQEQFKQERLIRKQEKEKAWELRKLCHEFLQDNDKDWEKRKNERLEEKSRLERIEKMKIKSKNAKIQHIEKTIEIGMNKIPEHEKNKILKEEKLKEHTETLNMKQDLWKLRKKEKKLVETEDTKKIRNLTKKLETIQEILEQEKQKKLKKELEEKITKKKKQDKLKLAREKAEKWAMARWINEFIEENQDRWEEMDLVRAQENHETQEQEEELELIEIQEKLEQTTAKENTNNQQKAENKKRKFEQDKPEQETTPNNTKIRITIVTNSAEITEITKKEDWLCWRKNHEQDKPEHEITPETIKADKIPETKIKLTMKQAKLTDLYNKQQTPISKQEKITTTSTEIGQRKQEITGEKTNKNKKPSTNNTNKKNPNNTNGKAKKASIVLRKPVLPEPKPTSNRKPVEEKDTVNNKITKFFTRNQQEITPDQKSKTEIPEKTINKTTILKPPNPRKTKPDSSKGSRKTKKKEEEEKTREKQRGYWLKLAENQKKKQQENKKIQNSKQEAVKSEKLFSAPGKQSTQQAYCKHESITARFSDSKADVLEPSNHLESNNQIKFESEITLGNQIKLG